MMKDTRQSWAMTRDHMDEGKSRPHRRAKRLICDIDSGLWSKRMRR